MSRRLVIRDGTREREMQLVGRLVVGRDPTCDISHDHSLLSRRHAEFVTTGNDVTVRDLGSRNGVFVNGVKAAERSLSPGDIVQIGPLRAQYVTGGAPVDISPEKLDVERTAMLHPLPATARAAAPDADTEAAENDDEVTRLMRPPGRPVTPADDSDEEMTRYVRAPATDSDAGGTVAIVMPPPGASAAPAVGVARPAAAAPETGTFVFLHLLTFAAVVLASAALPLLMWRRALLSVTGADGNSISLVWFAIPAAVALIATFVVGAAINRRFAQALTAQRNRT